LETALLALTLSFFKKGIEGGWGMNQNAFLSLLKHMQQHFKNLECVFFLQIPSISSPFATHSNFKHVQKLVKTLIIFEQHGQDIIYMRTRIIFDSKTFVCEGGQKNFLEIEFQQEYLES
jgi:hypothetical protein